MTSGKGASVRDMFAAIAPTYDSANRAISAGLDGPWRRTAIAELDPPPGGSVLDLCTGTGDLAFALHEHDRRLRIVGVDFCEPMLEPARRRDTGGHIRFVTADVLSLPFEPDSFDGAIMGFSMRNVVDIGALLREVRRVLRPGARFVNLDMSHPPNGLVRRAFNAYFSNVMPLIGGLISGEPRAYRYLPSSLVNYPGAERLAEAFRANGFQDVRFRRLALGAVAIHSGLA